MSFSPCLRGRISSPLEAGPSPADGHHLPGHVNEALEYVSKRLGKKGPPITLLIVRRDYQLPTSPIASPTSARAPLAVSTGSTPSKPTFPPTSRLEALKQLIRPNSSAEGQIRERIVHVHLDQLRNGTTSPAFSEASTISSAADSTFSHRVRWPGSPSAYGSVPVTPATPFTVMSSLSGADGNTAVSRFGGQSPNQFGMKLVYAHPLSPREEKSLAQALEKAAKKFKLDSSWLPQAVSPSALGLPVDLVLKSTAQNEALFASDRLALLSLDRLYTFRTALQAYARTKATCRLEDAVDELRRLFLANCRRALRKSAILAAYRWLDPINNDALADVCRMYERAYGGIERESGVENDVDPAPAWPFAEGDLEQALEKETTGARGRKRRVAPPPPRPEIPIHDLTYAIDKELLLSSADLDLTPDDASDLSAIEAWYREIQLQNDLPQEEEKETAIINIHPLRSHPATTTTTTTATTTTTTTTSAAAINTLPPPLSPPPPPPTSATYRNRPWAPQPTEPSLSEMRRTTPKLRPAPPRRPAPGGLKLQTTFGGRKQPQQPQQQQQPATTTHQAAGKSQDGGAVGGAVMVVVVEEGQGQGRGGDEGQGEGEEEEEEEELTARPHSAIKSFANARWTAAAGSTTTTTTGGVGNGVSIDEMLHGGGGGGQRDGDGGGGGGGENNNTLGSRQQQQHLRVSAAAEERVGPTTPNGYDDISPITRGEWGMLMFGKGRTVGVEMC